MLSCIEFLAANEYNSQVYPKLVIPEAFLIWVLSFMLFVLYTKHDT